MRVSFLPAAVLAAAVAAGGDPAPQQAMQEVRLHLTLSTPPHGTVEERERVRELEEELLGLLEAGKAGRLARDAWGAGTCVITLEAADAHRAWSLVEPAVRAYRPRPGSYAVVHGGVGAPEERFPLDTAPEPGAKPPTPPP